MTSIRNAAIFAVCAVAVLWSTAQTQALDARSPEPTPTDTPVAPLTIFPRVGSALPSRSVPKGPGLVLMGGAGSVDPAFAWMHDTIAGGHGVRGGDVVVLTAGSADAYTPYLMAVAPFNSVRSIQIGPAATAAQLETAARYVDAAQAVFFSGGDQAHYVRWKGTPLMAAVQRVYDRGGVIGGTSAGLAILGEHVYDSVAADEIGADVHTADALAHPDEKTISFTHDMLRFPPLRHVMTDTHFFRRDRLGRTIVFLARLQQQGYENVLGLGINERSAIVVGPDGIGTLLSEHHKGAALLVRLPRAMPIRPGKPFSASGVELLLMDRDGARIDFRTWRADGHAYRIDVDGAGKSRYEPADPYVAPADAGSTTS